MRMISLRSSPSSSCTRLLASTTSVGSMNTVLPVALSSCTIPLIFFFSVGITGITSLPSRSVGVTSFSTTPSLCAERNILYKVREMLPSVFASSLLICSNSGVALSRIFPYLSNIWSMRWIIWGKVITSFAKRCKAGYVYFFSLRQPSFSSAWLSSSSLWLRIFTMLSMVESERRRSKSSFSSRWVFSMRIRTMLSLTS